MGELTQLIEFHKTYDSSGLEHLFEYSFITRPEARKRVHFHFLLSQKMESSFWIDQRAFRDEAPNGFQIVTKIDIYGWLKLNEENYLNTLFIII